jgi:hypothetical protein
MFFLPLDISLQEWPAVGSAAVGLQAKATAFSNKKH